MNTKQKQALLFYLGYYVGNIDGNWGQLSKVACKSFQKDFGFSEKEQDGICGSDTEKALKHAVCYGISKKQDAVVSGDFWDDIKYWTREEFRCQCGGKYCKGFPVEPSEILVRLADKVRGHFGKPGHRSSGLRCKTWNAIQGGVSDSRHMSGKALDFRIEGKTAKQVLEYVQKQPECRYAYDIDGTYVHIDVK
jgi:hypothetical protein